MTLAIKLSGEDRKLLRVLAKEDERTPAAEATWIVRKGLDLYREIEAGQ